MSTENTNPNQLTETEKIITFIDRGITYVLESIQNQNADELKAHIRATREQLSDSLLSKVLKRIDSGKYPEDLECFSFIVGKNWVISEIRKFASAKRRIEATRIQEERKVAEQIRQECLISLSGRLEKHISEFLSSLSDTPEGTTQKRNIGIYLDSIVHKMPIEEIMEKYEISQNLVYQARNRAKELLIAFVSADDGDLLRILRVYPGGKGKVFVNTVLR